MNVDARLPNGILLQGGVSTGRTVTDNCDVVTKLDNPSELYCHVALPYLPNMQAARLLYVPGANPGRGHLPEHSGGIRFRAICGAQRGHPAIARPRSQLGTEWSVHGQHGGSPVHWLSDRVNQLDLRAARSFKRGKAELQGNGGPVQCFNSNPVTALNNTYGTTGATWLQPLQILASRVVRFSAHCFRHLLRLEVAGEACFRRMSLRSCLSGAATRPPSPPPSRERNDRYRLATAPAHQSKGPGVVGERRSRGDILMVTQLFARAVLVASLVGLAATAHAQRGDGSIAALSGTRLAPSFRA